jgi:hypothetical protein
VCYIHALAERTDASGCCDEAGVERTQGRVKALNGHTVVVTASKLKATRLKSRYLTLVCGMLLTSPQISKCVYATQVSLTLGPQQE